MSKKKQDAGIGWKSIDPHGACVLVGSFLSAVDHNIFIDDDGVGFYAASDRMSDVAAVPSDIAGGSKPPSWATHVVWLAK